MDREEMLGKLRMVIDSLDMALVYDHERSHGEVVKIHIGKYHAQVVFADGWNRLFKRWE